MVIKIKCGNLEMFLVVEKLPPRGFIQPILYVRRTSVVLKFMICEKNKNGGVIYV